MGCFVKKTHNSVVINENIKLLLSTSGTTGSPKFVKLSETNILTNALDISQYLNIQNTDVVPLNLPIYYSYGLSVLTSNAVIGNRVVCSNTDILNRLFWENLDRYKYSSLAGVTKV
jgi:acyl-CoA synthetase (AMP-forming)/AMP-acid ligase II